MSAATISGPAVAVWRTAEYFQDPWRRHDYSTSSRANPDVRREKQRWKSLATHGMLLLVLNACFIVVLMRPLVEDLASMATGAPLEGASGGWKALHGDVFRLPCSGAVLFALLAGGVHLLVFAGVCVGMAIAGTVLPVSQNAL